MSIILLFIVGVALIITVTALLYAWHAYKNEAAQKKEYIKLLSQKKSSEIILGQVTEKLVPFLKEFKHDPQQSSFLGQPIDYVVFGDDGITFVEIKSGNSRLSTKQRKIKQQILDKKVYWEQLNIKP